LNKKDETYMKMAMELAEGGIGFVNPNPLVGAVIVKDDRIIGAGFHEEYGHPHAERNALAACTEDPAGSTIYVTLEPCCHYGKNPPCTDAIIEAGIARVVIGSRDPNPAGGRQRRETPAPGRHRSDRGFHEGRSATLSTTSSFTI
jgi:diaminohydroxyphosphoribosylaminopyrimidine deaminase/5-amino-6-(5-phosphoribosylamino)uracil reductase